MTMISLLLVLFLAAQEPDASPSEDEAAFHFPKPVLEWTVPFPIRTPLVDSFGRTFLFSGKQLYIYDLSRNLVTNIEMLIEPQRAFLGPGATLWMHDGKDRLVCLDQDHHVLWQKRLNPSTVQPFSYGKSVVYSLANQLLLIDADHGRIGTSRFHRGLGNVLPFQEAIFYAVEGEGSFKWDPFRRITSRVFTGYKSGIKFISTSFAQDEALTFDDNTVAVQGKKQQRKWERVFNLDIDLAPIWLEREGESVLVLATEARFLYVFDRLGLEIGKYRLQDRPRQFMTWGSELCVAIPNLSNRLIWYNARQNQFAEQVFPKVFNGVAENTGFVLFVSEDGTLRLYDRTNTSRPEAADVP